MPTTELGDGTSSQGDTEPLTFEEDEVEAEGEMDDDQDMIEADATNALMPSSLSREGDVEGGGAQMATLHDAELADGAEEDEDEDEEQEEDEDAEVDSDAEEEGDDQADVNGEGDAEGDDDGFESDGEEDEEEAQENNDDVSQSQTTAGNSSPNKAAVGATFSDESDLTDEPDEEDEDAEGEDDGGEEEGEGDDEDEDEEGDEEDEAAKGLAALTSGQTAGLDDDDDDDDGGGGGGASVDPSAANDGLEGLAVLAAAEAGEDSQGEEGTDNDSIAGSSVRHKARKQLSAIPRRTATRLNEVIVASPQLSEDDDDVDDDEDEDEAENGLNGQGSGEKNVSTSNKGNRALSSLIGLSNVAKRNVKQGATGLLAGAPSITIEGLGSGVPSAATSREASPAPAEGEERQLNEEYKAGLEQERDEAGTPVQEIDEAQAEDEQSTDEAALRRLEAMDSLTKIEIGFALLRDKLYVERMDEVNKEGEMILDGTHPDLIHLSNLIENRRERKLKLVDKWFEQEEKQYERVAKAEEAAAWNNWRNEVVELRKQQMNESARKRRKLDREKRSLDGPRPARRHQIFETELVRNPDYDRKMRLHQRHDKKGKIQSDDQMGAYVAFPDLRGAEEHESWMDMERMGIAPDARYMGIPPGGYYRPEDVGMDPYAVYPIDQPAPGPAPGYVSYAGVPPATDIVPYERPYDSRGSGQHAYNVDGYGRPLSPQPQPPPPPPPPPAPHVFPAQRGAGARPTESYEPSHHAHASYGPKVNRRSPPPHTLDERDVKQRTSGQRHNSPPISSHQAVRPPPSSRPQTHYAKHGNAHSEEAAYYNAPPAKSSSMNVMGPGSVSAAARPRGPPGSEIAGSYTNRHDHYSR